MAQDDVDALSALAPLFRVRPELQTLCQFATPWASPHESEPAGWAPFHLVTDGACVLAVQGEPPMPLEAGDIALLPHGDAHVIHGLTPNGRGGPIRITAGPAIDLKSNTDQPEVELICGRLAFEQPHDNLARTALPRIIRVRTKADASARRLHTLVIAIRDEIEAGAAGARAICNDLASALLVMVLRAHFEQSATRGVLSLLTQKQTARALTAMMADPARAWSLDEIAASAATSRATLVREFRRLAQATPFEVLAEIRLALARHSLATSNRPLADVAADIGYQSQSAFSRAFQRRFGVAPSEMRANS